MNSQIKLFPQKNMNYTPQSRIKQFIWVTWLAKVLAEEIKCIYSIQQISNYQFPKQPNNYDSTEHDEKVIQRAITLEEQDFTVYVEQQNSFKVNGKIYDVCVSGRPDIVAVKDEWVIVEDIKTGKRKNSHKMQVLLYMLLLPLALETQDICQKQIPHGRLIYPDGIVEIPAWQVDRKFRQRLREAIAIIANSKSLNPKPSPWECRYCQIPHEYCQAKMAIRG
ncbi:MAG: PD-(D/E)XK nuclease family protein [Microcoleaceae cyanobacterium]